MRLVLEQSQRIRVIAEAGTVCQAVGMALLHTPEVAVVDVSLPDGSGIAACRKIRAVSPKTRVLFLSELIDEDTIAEMITAGSDGYLLKNTSREGFSRAVESVAYGHSIFSPDIVARFTIRTQAFAHPDLPQNTVQLTCQEQRILGLVAKGYTNKEVAQTLLLSEKTVRNYLSRIFQKLQVTRRSEAAACFVRLHQPTLPALHKI